MASTTAFTVKDFLALKLPKDRRHELVAGELVEMAYSKHRHEKVKANGIRILVGYLTKNPIGELYVETTFELAEDEARQPDLALLLNEQIPVPAVDELLALAPALAIEVVSSETLADFERKVELFLEEGSRAVWALFLDLRAVRIFVPGGASRLVRGDQPVEADFLPGFSVPASRFFEGL